jgi:hypothetical protein
LAGLLAFALNKMEKKWPGGYVAGGLNYVAFMHPTLGKLNFRAHKLQYDTNPLQEYMLLKDHDESIYKGMIEVRDTAHRTPIQKIRVDDTCLFSFSAARYP